ncbi:MAG: peptide/nickel transport system permease protein [Gaiellaceae bacterium]|jgi:peptide/nickel transport system permease protein|nr:peptide/nickel transport system permease protein [Gaiellaceae bacterium]
MGGFLLRKVGAALIVLVLASMLVFVGVRAIPGDPALALGGENRDPAVLAFVRHKYGLDKPLPVQYVNWASLAVRGDLGTDQRELSVSRTIVQRLPITLELAGLAILVGSLIGIVAGVLAAVRRGKPTDYAATTVALVGLSVPHFWLGIVMIIYFAVRLHWLPAGGYVAFSTNPIQNLEHMLMPAIVLGTGLSAVLMRQMRSSMLSALGADYVRTARAKGLSEWSVVGKHALRNSLITVTTVIGLQLGALISGAVITEQIFVIPGFGRLTIDAVNQRDYTLLQGVVLVAAVGYVVVNLLVDVVYSLLNPRIRVAGAGQ